MQEQLTKSIRNTQGVLVLLCVAVLAFVLEPSDWARYERAIGALVLMESTTLPEPHELVDQAQAQLAEGLVDVEARLEEQLRVTDSLWVRVRPQGLIELLRTDSMSVAEIMQFWERVGLVASIGSPPVVDELVDSLLHRPQPGQVQLSGVTLLRRGRASVVIEANFSQVIGPSRLCCADIDMVRLWPEDVEVTAARLETVDPANPDLERVIRALPDLVPVLYEIGTLYPEEASAYLRSRSANSRRRLSTLGLEVDERSVLVLGPLTVLAATLLLLAQLMQLEGASVDGRIYPWIGLFLNPVARVLTLLSIGFLPPLTCLLVVVLLGSAGNWQTRLAFGIFVLCGIASVVSARRCVAIRKEVHGKTPDPAQGGHSPHDESAT